MSEVKAWKCDICGTIFLEDVLQFGSRSTIDIHFEEIDINNSISQTSQAMISEDVHYRLDDVCFSCRIKLLNAIQAVVEKDDAV